MPSTASTSDLLTTRRLLTLTVSFIAIVLCLQGLSRLSVGAVPTPLGISRYFPVSYFHPRVPDLLQGAGAAVGIALLFGIGLPLLHRIQGRYRPVLAALIGLLAILATTATQGIDRGFVYPVAGREPHAGGQQYWHDAEERHIETPADAGRFLREFPTIQASLHEHARTHPPGAVLFFAGLRILTGNRPALAAIVIASIAVALTAIALFPGAGIPKEASLLLFLMPAVQIYYCATLDAIVTGLLLVAIIVFARGRNLWGEGALAALVLAGVSFLTFGWVWVVPILAVAEVAPRLLSDDGSVKEVRAWLPLRAGGVLLALLLFYGVLYLGSGFNYLAAFRLASHLENPMGFRLVADPAGYIATRLEDIAEIAVFCGPYILWLIPRGLPRLRRESPQLWAICLAAVGTLLALFLTGAFRTGETARACLFVFPFLVIPALGAPISERDLKMLYRLIFTQAVLMQCFGFWFW